MKKIKITLVAIILLILPSCEDWFDVTSKSEIREEQHYSTVVGFQQSLIGCYILMTEDRLYGKYLSWHLVEMLGNQFYPIRSTSDSELEYSIQNYNFGNKVANLAIEDIWASSYNVIANVNEALIYIEKKRNVLDDINYHIIKGELLAIRAYMHFDLLRLYGYGDWANRASELDNKLAIPYVKTLSKEPVARSTGKEVINMILTDLTEAEALLKDYDPITGKHDASFYSNVNYDGFFNNRTIHLNYYAVKGLQARVLIWEGSSESKSKALQSALEIITVISNGGIDIGKMNTTLTYLDANNITRSKATLAAENLFGINVATLENRITKYIKPNYSATDEAAFYLSPNDAAALYENISGDVRFSVLLTQSFSSPTLGYVPLKVYQDKSITEYYKNKVSMIRIPEIYYIAAECYTTGTSPDLNKAIELLNVTREKRGIEDKLQNLTTVQILEEIKKEYHKEYLSEGVMFYYYKRTGASNVPHYVDVMTDEQYVLPRPEFEK